MRKWEYRIITASNLHEFEITMCEAGSEGWAFAAMMASEANTPAALMKRSLPTMAHLPPVDD